MQKTINLAKFPIKIRPAAIIKHSKEGEVNHQGDNSSNRK